MQLIIGRILEVRVILEAWELAIDEITSMETVEVCESFLE
jgi:hypothetical protein